MPGVPSRREALLLVAPLTMKSEARVSANAIRARLPREAPPGVAAIIANTLNGKPSALNRDWFGTSLVEGLLRWCKRGITEVRPFAVAWLDHHLATSDSAHRSTSRRRIVLAGGLPMRTYAGHFGLAFPCYEMARQFGDTRTDPEYAGFVRDLEKLADGMSRVQDESGGLRVLLNDPATPLETTGTAMFASGASESIRRGWLRDSHAPNVSRAWRFVKGNITDSGGVRSAYTGRAVPAEQRRIADRMNHQEMGWVQGLILRSADELTRPAAE